MRAAMRAVRIRCGRWFVAAALSSVARRRSPADRRASPMDWCGVFTQPFGPVKLLRDIGLLAFDLMPPAKAAMSQLSSVPPGACHDLLAARRWWSRSDEAPLAPISICSIVGGGMVGACFAATCRDAIANCRRLRIALLDAQPPDAASRRTATRICACRRSRARRSAFWTRSARGSTFRTRICPPTPRWSYGMRRAGPSAPGRFISRQANERTGSRTHRREPPRCSGRFTRPAFRNRVTVLRAR